MDLKDKILTLKKKRGAVILAHYYQIPEIQDIADYVGDSYYLSKIAKNLNENIIVFCGVKFMAESAKILSPEKTVILPVKEAGCVMADMAEEKDLYELKKDHPNAKVVCYINSSTEIKALSDVCCTSSNAETIINNLPEKEIIFLPDRNLGSYIQEKIPNKKIILWNGFCIVHEFIQIDEIIRLKNEHKDSLVVCHPECKKIIRDISDFVGSTSEMINFVSKSQSRKFIIITEQGILHQLKNKNSNKYFYIPYENMVCKNMKMIKLKDVYESLFNMKNKIEIDEELRLRAYNSLKNMHLLGD